MSRPERQFAKKPIMENGWYVNPERQDHIKSFQAFEGGVPNNPQNLSSFIPADDGEEGGKLVRRSLYGDGERVDSPETPAITQANQWAGRSDRDIPDVDSKVRKSQRAVGFTFPTTGSYANTSRVPGRLGTNFGTGKRNAPPPES